MGHSFSSDCTKFSRVSEEIRSITHSNCISGSRHWILNFWSTVTEYWGRSVKTNFHLSKPVMWREALDYRTLTSSSSLETNSSHNTFSAKQWHSPISCTLICIYYRRTHVRRARPVEEPIWEFLEELVPRDWSCAGSASIWFASRKSGWTFPAYFATSKISEL